MRTRLGLTPSNTLSRLAQGAPPAQARREPPVSVLNCVQNVI